VLYAEAVKHVADDAQEAQRFAGGSGYPEGIRERSHDGTIARQTGGNCSMASSPRSRARKRRLRGGMLPPDVEGIAAEESRPMALTDLADRIFKNRACRASSSLCTATG